MMQIRDEAEMRQLGARLGVLLGGGEVIELVGDVGAGKTTFAKGLAVGLGIDEAIQSPSFTISRTYDARDDLRLMHYDFYRLDDPGIMAADLAEATRDDTVVTIIEWADIAANVLPADRLTLRIAATDDDEREVTIEAHGTRAQQLAGALA